MAYYMKYKGGKRFCKVNKGQIEQAMSRKDRADVEVKVTGASVDNLISKEKKKMGFDF